MRTKAAILRDSPGKFEVVDVELEDPRQGEIRVKLAAAGLCHSDEHMQSGDSPPGHLPIVAGHEGAGIVEEVGPHTEGWEVGDHVVFSFIPSCGRCRFCAEGMTNLCDLGAFTWRGSRYDDPDSFRVSVDGEPCGQLCGLGTFAERTVVSTKSAVKIGKHLPLDKMVLLGCGVGTGWGSAVYAADTRPGDVVIVMGVGGVGVNAVQGASHAGATAVIAVDPVALKRETAEQVGATHSFASIAEAAECAKTLTDGQGADKAVVTVGVTTGEHIGQAFAAIRKGGTVVVTGVGNTNDTDLTLPITEISFYQKRIQGALFGASNPVSDIPRQVRMYEAGQLKLDELITKTYRLDELAEGYDDLLSGRTVRGIIIFD